jgi:hypothetical protein
MDALLSVGNVDYQLVWKILPGLRGLSCSEFKATDTSAPDNEKGVAFRCKTESERDDLLKLLETTFESQRFSNNATAFETVKAFVTAWNSQHA